MPSLCEHAVDAIKNCKHKELDEVLRRMKEWPAAAKQMLKDINSFDQLWEQQTTNKPDPNNISMSVDGKDSRRYIGEDNTNPYYSNTPLIVAARMNDIHSLDALLKAGARDDIFDENGKNALFWAVELGNHKIVNALLNHFALRNKPLEISGVLYQQYSKVSGETPLSKAAALCHPVIINNLRITGAYPSATVLENLLKSTQPESQKLLALKAIFEPTLPKSPVNTKETKQIQVSQITSPKTKQYLAQEGQELGVMSSSQKVNKGVELAEGNESLAAQLSLQPTKDEQAETKQIAVADEMSFELQQIPKGIKVAVLEEPAFRAALKVAVSAEPPMPSVVQYLCKQAKEKGFDLNVSLDESGNKAVFLAAQLPNKQAVLRVLAEAKLDFNSRAPFIAEGVTYSNSTPLMVAVRKSVSTDQIKFLILNGANVDLVNDKGNSVLDYACCTAMVEHVKVLVQASEERGEQVKFSQSVYLRGIYNVIYSYKHHSHIDKNRLLEVLKFLIPKLNNLHITYQGDSLFEHAKGHQNILTVLDEEAARRKKAGTTFDKLKRYYSDLVKDEAKILVDRAKSSQVDKAKNSSNPDEKARFKKELKDLLEGLIQGENAEEKYWYSPSMIAVDVAKVSNKRQLQVFTDRAAAIVAFIESKMNDPLKEVQIDAQDLVAALNFIIRLEANKAKSMTSNVEGDNLAPNFIKLWNIIIKLNAFDVLKTKEAIYDRIPLDCAMAGKNPGVAEFIQKKLLQYLPATQKRLAKNKNGLGTNADLFDLLFLVEAEKTKGLDSRKLAQRIIGIKILLDRLNGHKLLNVPEATAKDIIYVVKEDTSSIFGEAKASKFAGCLGGLLTTVSVSDLSSSEQPKPNLETKDQPLTPADKQLISNLEKQCLSVMQYFRTRDPGNFVYEMLQDWEAPKSQLHQGQTQTKALEQLSQGFPDAKDAKADSTSTTALTAGSYNAPTSALAGSGRNGSVVQVPVQSNGGTNAVPTNGYRIGNSN